MANVVTFWAGVAVGAGVAGVLLALALAAVARSSIVVAVETVRGEREASAQAFSSSLDLVSQAIERASAAVAYPGSGAAGAPEPGAAVGLGADATSAPEVAPAWASDGFADDVFGART